MMTIKLIVGLIHLKIVPAQAFQCYECSSEIDGSCAVPNANANKDRLTTTCPDDVTKCFTEVKSEKRDWIHFFKRVMRIVL